jgi:hypothetical protein
LSAPPLGGQPQERGPDHCGRGHDRRAELAGGEQAVALAVFVAVGTVGPGLPVAIYFAMGERAKRLLDELKGWLGAHNTAIMAVLCLVIGTKLIGDGIAGLA